MKIRYLILSVIILLSGSCSPPPKINLPFDFDHPAEIIKLPQRLHEISGITFYNKKELACVQDEKGIVFFYDIKKDKLRNNIPFGKDRDFEGITDVNDTLFVLCSNGEISEVDNKDENSLVNIYSTFLSKENNCEGLCFDKKKHQLLVACKGRPKKGTAAKGMKAVYAFDLDKRELQRDPVYIIDPDSVQKNIVSTTSDNFFKRLFRKSTYEDTFLFEPSEICIDPVTDDVYILSSVGKTFLALTYDGKIKFAVHLNPEIYKQPEGLAFSNDGSMFISDEGRGGKANLIKINRIKNYD